MFFGKIEIFKTTKLKNFKNMLFLGNNFHTFFFGELSVNYYLASEFVQRKITYNNTRIRKIKGRGRGKNRACFGPFIKVGYLISATF